MTSLDILPTALPQKMRVGFTGAKKGMTDAQVSLIMGIIATLDPSELHHGDCIGADATVHDVVFSHMPEVKIVVHPPKDPSRRAYRQGHEMRPRLNYLSRNHKIVDEVDVLLAAPATAEVLRSGTWATVRYARKSRVPVLAIGPDGDVWS